MMKVFQSIIWSGILALLFVCCEYDNYSEPGSLLQGNLVFNGEPIHISNNSVEFELWEPGWQKSAPIYVSVNQDGAYSASLFDATYKLIIPEHQGPFRCVSNVVTNSDTIIVEVNGNMNFNIEVEPYYMIRNVGFDVIGREVTATFGLEQVITDENARSVEKVSFYINKTRFVDFQWKVADVSIDGGDIEDMTSMSMTLTVPDIVPSQNYVFARIGVKIEGREDMLFSGVEKISL